MEWNGVEFEVGDKIEITDTVNDGVVQGWVEGIMPTLNDLSRSATTVGWIIKFRGASRHTLNLTACAEVRVLVKHKPPIKEGDVVDRPSASEFPNGTILRSTVNEGASRITEWVVVDHPVNEKRFVCTSNGIRKHTNFNFSGPYRIIHLGREN